MRTDRGMGGGVVPEGVDRRTMEREQTVDEEMAQHENAACTLPLEARIDYYIYHLRRALEEKREWQHQHSAAVEPLMALYDDPDARRLGGVGERLGTIAMKIIADLHQRAEQAERERDSAVSNHQFWKAAAKEVERARDRFRAENTKLREALEEAKAEAENFKHQRSGTGIHPVRPLTPRRGPEP